MPADGLILRHVAAGLPEKPYRGAVDGMTQAGAKEARGARLRGAAGGAETGARLEVSADLLIVGCGHVGVDPGLPIWLTKPGLRVAPGCAAGVWGV